MSLRVYNTLSGQKEPFEPVHAGKVGIYLCGPTVYKSPHIGHMVGPVIFDAIKRHLTFRDYKVTWVVNITDVDDKLINAANKAGMTMQAMAEKHTAQYLECLGKLGVPMGAGGIDVMPKASEHIPEIIALCEKLVTEGKAYSADGNVWFDVSKDNDYGKLSHRRPEDQEAGNRELEGSGKRAAADFALWKAAKTGEPSWDSPWGKGRPGWHIECSAMSMKILGPTFDLHGGGMDLMFPHHENELAQSEQATGKPFAKFWMHNGLTRIRTKSTSGEWQSDIIGESRGTAGSVRANDLIDTHGAEVLRYLLLSSHYRRPIEFTDEALANAKKAMGIFARLFERVERLGAAPVQTALSTDAFAESVTALRSKFLDAMDDDFNTAGAIGVLHELAGEINGHLERTSADRDKPAAAIQAATAAVATMKELGGILGLFRSLPASARAEKDAGLTEQLMQLMIKLRADARASKNFALADAIRKGLGEIGVTIEDRPDGTGWRKSE